MKKRISFIFAAIFSLSACSNPDAVNLDNVPPFPNEAPPQTVYSDRVKATLRAAEELKAETEAVRAAQDNEAEYYGR